MLKKGSCLVCVLACLGESIVSSKGSFMVIVLFVVVPCRKVFWERGCCLNVFMVWFLVGRCEIFCLWLW